MLLSLLFPLLLSLLLPIRLSLLLPIRLPLLLPLLLSLMMPIRLSLLLPPLVLQVRRRRRRRRRLLRPPLLFGFTFPHELADLVPGRMPHSLLFFGPDVCCSLTLEQSRLCCSMRIAKCSCRMHTMCLCILFRLDTCKEVPALGLHGQGGRGHCASLLFPRNGSLDFEAVPGVAYHLAQELIGCCYSHYCSLFRDLVHFLLLFAGPMFLRPI